MGAGSVAGTLAGDAAECLQAGICLDVPKSYGKIRGKKMLEVERRGVGRGTLNLLTLNPSPRTYTGRQESQFTHK